MGKQDDWYEHYRPSFVEELERKKLKKALEDKEIAELNEELNVRKQIKAKVIKHGRNSS